MKCKVPVQFTDFHVDMCVHVRGSTGVFTHVLWFHCQGTHSEGTLVYSVLK